MGSRRQALAKDFDSVMSKDIGAKNPLFSQDHLQEFHDLFSLYADPRQRKVDVRDILMTAKVLGLDRKYEFVYRVIEEIAEAPGGDAVNFQQLVKGLGDRIGHPFNDEGRKSTFDLLDTQRKGVLDIDDLRYLSDQFRYNLSDDQIVEIIHNVGGFGSHEITWERFNRYILRKIEGRRI